MKNRFAEKTPQDTGILENFSEWKLSIQLQTPALLKVDAVLQLNWSPILPKIYFLENKNVELKL